MYTEESDSEPESGWGVDVKEVFIFSCGRSLSRGIRDLFIDSGSVARTDSSRILGMLAEVGVIDTSALFRGNVVEGEASGLTTGVLRRGAANRGHVEDSDSSSLT